MKNARFIALLNLYVDRQLSGAEAAELEAEIHANPERARVYRQYCRMQRACASMFAASQAEAPKSAAFLARLDEAEEGDYAALGRRGWFGGATTWAPAWPMTGAFAAAACVVVVAVFALRSGGDAVGIPGMASAEAGRSGAGEATLAASEDFGSFRPVASFSPTRATRIKFTGAEEVLSTDWMAERDRELAAARRAEIVQNYFEQHSAPLRAVQPDSESIFLAGHPDFSEGRYRFESAAFQFQR